MNRRTFLGTLAAAAATPVAAMSAPHRKITTADAVCVFSKHLQYLDFAALAETIAAAGYTGIDLTVRPGGHVLPERVEEDLPKAQEAARKAGVPIVMMATAIADADDALSRRILTTAAAVGITHYRMAWLPYLEGRSNVETLDEYRPRLKELAAFNQSLGIHGAYQNHAGTLVGGPIWDIYYLLRDVDPEWLGVQYDLRHATVEGGTSWRVDLNLIYRLINLQAVKDFRWEKVGARWQAVTVPLGEGMVDWSAYWKIAHEKGIRTPITLHFEYPFPGDDGKTLAASRRATEATALMRRDREKMMALQGERM